MTSPLKGTYFIPIEIEHSGEHCFRVECAYYPGRPGRMYMPNGDPGYPDDPPEVEITGMCWKNHKGDWVDVWDILGNLAPGLCNEIEEKAATLSMQDDWEDIPEERDDDPWVREEL